MFRVYAKASSQVAERVARRIQCLETVSIPFPFLTQVRRPKTIAVLIGLSFLFTLARGAFLDNPTRTILVTHAYLRLPIKNDGVMRRLTLIVDGQAQPPLQIKLADGTPDWWAWQDVTAFQGKEITLEVNRLPKDSQALAAIGQADQITRPDNLYREPLRPQFHFSSQRGWLNDPNGLAFYRGEYHLFYQHNPYGVIWGNMHWGHAVSRDLVHWKELSDALYPDAMGSMFSGSAVVDWKNTSAFGKDGQPPLVLIYTAQGNPTTQCLASSLDGRTFTKYRGNPVLQQIAGGNRDPKVIWYEPAQRWVMVLYVGFPTGKRDAKGHAVLDNTVCFLGSPNLKDWTVLSRLPFSPECPDFFELPLDGDAHRPKWVLTSASGEYQVGTFDGTKFTPETPRLRGSIGSTSYAAQTYSDLPKEDGRRIHLGWLRAASPGMPFNQEMSLPIELKLVTTSEGPRLTWTPVQELHCLRGPAQHLGPLLLKPGDANPLASIHGELLEIRTQFRPAPTGQVCLNVRGASVVYDAATGEISVNGERAPAPLRDGSQQLTIYLDRTSIEVFADQGLVYIPKAFIPQAADHTVLLTANGGAARIESLEVYPLKSAWE